MSSNRKHFDKNLYAAFDQKAKDKVQELLKAYPDLKSCGSPIKTDVDLMVYRDRDHIFNIETEVKAVWTSDDFPYDSVQFPYRKLKYCILTKPTLFVMFNAKMNKYLSVTSYDMMHSPVNMVRNKYVKFGEDFFQVPLDKVSFNALAIDKLGV